MNITKLFAGSLLLLLPAGIAAAQTGAPVATPANTVSCFDYYTFGSVQADLTAPVTGTVSGAPITFSGKLVNNNPYPIVDGALYVKIFRSRGSVNDGNGPDVVDQFIALGDIVIPAHGSVPVSFSWRVPSYAVSGQYQLATFFTTSRKFNLLGLSFTDDVVGNTVPFKVTGEQSKGVMFDKAGVTVNGDSYHFAAFPPRESATAAVPVVAKIRNTTGSAEKASILWTIYQWDAQLRQNAVQEETHTVMVPAGGSVNDIITVTDAKYPVYLAVGTLTWKDTKSVIGVRFVRDGVDRTRINFPGITSFPLVAGQPNTLFSCLHNAGTSDSVPNGRLELTLADMNGNTIESYTYTGDVTGAMMGVADKFTPKANYDHFMLNARLYSGDQFIDEAQLEYDCNKIDLSNCQPASAVATNLSGLGAGSFGPVAVIIVLIALLVIAIVVRMWFKKPMVPPPNQPM